MSKDKKLKKKEGETLAAAKRRVAKEKAKAKAIRKKKRNYTIKALIYNAFVLLRIILIFALICAVIIAIGYGIYKKVFRIKKVEISGNVWVSDETMKEYLFAGEKDPNLIKFYLKNKFKEKVQIPYVETYECSFDWPNKLVVKVYEKGIIGYIRKGDSYYYFDRDGIILSISEDVLSGLMKVSGVEVTDYELNKSMGADPVVINAVFEIGKQLKKYNLEFEEIMYNYRNEFILKKGDLKVDLGDSDYIVEKIFELSQVYYELPKTSGILHLENCNGQKSNLHFSPD